MNNTAATARSGRAARFRRSPRHEVGGRSGRKSSCAWLPFINPCRTGLLTDRDLDWIMKRRRIGCGSRKMDRWRW
jgi:hypothetical protein